MIRKLFVVDGRSEREIVLAGTVVVGRDPTCHVSDMDSLLSRRHAEFVLNDDGAMVRDLKSRNGVFVNGVKLAERRLEPGDIVQLGHLHVRYVEEESPAVEYDQRAHATTATGMAATVAVLGASVPARKAAAPPAESSRAQAHDAEATGGSALPPASPSIDDAGLDVTTLPASARPATPSATTPPARPYSPDDFDSTRLAASRYSEAEITRASAPLARPARPAMDLDATMLTTPPLQAAQKSASAPAPQAVAERPTEAWLVTDASLTITEASPTCADLLGARPDTIVGGPLAGVLAQALGLISSGSGPSPLTWSVERTPSNGALTITFTAGKASGTSS